MSDSVTRTLHLANGLKEFGCELLEWNFYNASAKEYYLEVLLARIVAMDPGNEAFDGIFFDAAMAFMRGGGGCPPGAANCPANVTQAETDQIGTELLARTAANLAKLGSFSPARTRWRPTNIEACACTSASRSSSFATNGIILSPARHRCWKCVHRARTIARCNGVVDSKVKNTS